FHFLLPFPFPELSDPEIPALPTPDATVRHVGHRHCFHCDHQFHQKHQRIHGTCFISSDDPYHSQERRTPKQSENVFQDCVFSQFSSVHGSSPPFALRASSMIGRSSFNSFRIFSASSAYSGCQLTPE